MSEGEGMVKPIVFTDHSRARMRAREEDVREAIRVGQREPAQRGLFLYRLNLEFQREWDGHYYGIQQVAPVVAEEEGRFVVVTVDFLLPRGRATMKITYDKEADALYFRLLEGEFQCRNVQLTADITLDFAAGERLVGVEVLGASRLFEKPDAPTVELRALLPKVTPS